MSAPPPPGDGADSRPGTVVAVTRELMDRSRLSRGDLEITFVGVDDLAATVVANPVDRVVIDLAVPGVLAAVSQLAGAHDDERDEGRGPGAGGPRPPVIAYGPHVDRDRLAEARRAGCDHVLARSAFFSRWPEIG